MAFFFYSFFKLSIFCRSDEKFDGVCQQLHNEHKLKPCIHALCSDDDPIYRTHVRTYTIVRMALNSIDEFKDGRMSPPPLRASSDNFVCVSFIGRQLNLDCSTIAKRVHHALHACLALLGGLKRLLAFASCVVESKRPEQNADFSVRITRSDNPS